MRHSLTVLSQNMSINNGNVEQRYADFCGLVLARQPDLILVQEVSTDMGRVALQKLTADLGDAFTFHYETVYPGQEEQQGLGVISRLAVNKSCIINPKQAGNKVQLVETVWHDQPLPIVNMHLEAATGLESRRLFKFRFIAHYLKNYYGTVGQIVAGDANSVPFSLGLQAFKRRYGFQSAYQTVHGNEPTYTFPAISAHDLVDGRYIQPAQLRLLQRLAKAPGMRSKTVDGLPRYTLDYIFTNNHLEVLGAETVRSTDGTAASISDHLGLTAEIVKK